MDFVDKQHVVVAEVGKQRSQITRPFDGWAGGDTQADAELVGDNVGQGRLAEPWRPGEQNMVERLIAPAGRLYEHPEALDSIFLTNKVVKEPWAKAQVERPVLVAAAAGNNPFNLGGMSLIAHGFPFICFICLSGSQVLEGTAN
jgi:hypothetical protein